MPVVGFDSPFPNQRWQIATPQPEQTAHLGRMLGLSPLLAQILLNRGIDTFEAAQVFLNPELQILPSPLEEFEDLPIALELLLRAIADRQLIAICGDYDADGMTSTALLLRALRYLGATVDYAIPSRMQEGYGINRRIVEEFHQEGVRLILTVDNGIAAHDPIACARELGLAVIVTDHHDLPPTLPNANAILNPKLIREASPYRGVAGVGVAYILAVCLAQSLQKMQDLTTPLIELFTLGTIADLAPLTGVNRRWVRRGLKLLPKSKLSGIQALIQVAGLSQEKALKPEAIGFRLGPRINAIGRISDPQIVIELLTTDEDGCALELAMKCEQVNQLRQRLCELIEQDAIAWCQETQFNPQQSRVLVIVQPGWHHGVIGIVASRLVERYGVPVFIGTYEEEDVTEVENTEEREPANSEGRNSAETAARIRGSARSIPEFDIFDALQACADLLERFGGHRAAGGFTFAAVNLDAFRARLEAYAHQQLRPEHLKPLVVVDVQADFRDLTLELYQQMDVLHPCGIENSDPVFWTPNVQVLEQKRIGRDQTHLALTLSQTDRPGYNLRALAWRWGQFYPLPARLDVAYRLRLNEWNGHQSIELEIAGIRPILGAETALPPQSTTVPLTPSPTTPSLTTPSATTPTTARKSIQIPTFSVQSSEGGLNLSKLVNRAAAPSPVPPADSPAVLNPEDFLSGAEEEISCFDLCIPTDGDALSSSQSPRIEFYYGRRKYTGSIYQGTAGKELRIINVEGQLLIIQAEQRRGFIGDAEGIKAIDVSQPQYFNLVRSALAALELFEKERLLQEKSHQIQMQERQIASLQHQLDVLQQQLDQAISQAATQPAHALSNPTIASSDLSIPPSLSSPNRRSVPQPIYQPVGLPANSPINLTAQSSYPSIHSSVHPPVHPPAHLPEVRQIGQKQPQPEIEPLEQHLQPVEYLEQINPVNLELLEDSVLPEVKADEAKSESVQADALPELATPVGQRIEQKIEQKAAAPAKSLGKKVEKSRPLQEPQQEPQQDAALWLELEAETKVVSPHVSPHASPPIPAPELAPEPKPIPQAPVSRTNKLEDPKQRLREELGEAVWSRLDPRSQKDLVAAYKKQMALQTEDLEAKVDYSDVALRLCSVIEREVIQPFFKEIHQFLLQKNQSFQIGGVSLRARKKYTLGMLPPLLKEQWQSFQEETLSNAVEYVDEQNQTTLYVTINAEPIDPKDRTVIQSFLKQWQHPLANWLRTQTEDAASTVAQIDKLLTIAADAENVLQEWQFELLQALILGDQPGILRQIYAQSTREC